MSIARDGIIGHRLTREEFDALGLVDGRHFAHSATNRFREWRSSFDSDHEDWDARAEVQDCLALLTRSAMLEHAGHVPGQTLRILFTGAALGSVATYFHAARLRELDLFDGVRIEICDLLQEPLDRTLRGDFDFTDDTASRTGLAHLLTPASYKKLLRGARGWRANVIELSPAQDGYFDVVVAPYLHHHLNFIDKALACAELSRVTRPGGLCIIGDLTFDYDQFSAWLERHSEERVPYALECFISRQQHEGLVTDTIPVAHVDGEFYYATALKKKT